MHWTALSRRLLLVILTIQRTVRSMNYMDKYNYLIHIETHSYWCRYLVLQQKLMEVNRSLLIQRSPS